MAEMTLTKVRVTLTDNSGQWFNHNIALMGKVLQIMGKTVINEADVRVPRKSNALRDSHRVVELNPKAVAVIYGGGAIKYGDYQERGMRRDGTRVVKKYTTPGTGKEYLQDSGKKVVKRGIKWLLSHSLSS